VDHGKLVALDTPARLKDSVAGTDVVEAEFTDAPASWLDELRRLPAVAELKEQNGVVHIASHDGPALVGALMDLARERKITVRRVTVQGTTLDDVFLQYTGRQLRDEVTAGSKFDISHLYK
jgi:ABC-2 type transport system ATP-binding protein